MEAIDHYEMTIQRVLYGWVVFAIPLSLFTQIGRYHTKTREYRTLARIACILIMSLSLLFLFQRSHRYFEIEEAPTTPTRTKPVGYEIETIEPGDGATYPKKGDKVGVHYTGTLLNGQEFDSSKYRNKLFEFTVGQGNVIKCWDEGITRISVSETAKLTCSPGMAYGDQEVAGLIPANSTLIFEITLHELKSKNKGVTDNELFEIKLLKWQKQRHKIERDMYLATCSIL